MEPVVRHSLCPDYDTCPEVALYPDQVVIGEEGNQVRLTPREWERLVMAMQSGELGGATADPRCPDCPDCPPDCC